MNKREYLIELYEEYKGLLTEKQKTYFESYYFEDLSFNEIAELNKVTKSLVGKTINGIVNKLNCYENILRNKEKSKKIESLINKTKDIKIIKELEELL